MRTFEQRHCCIDSPDLNNNLMSLHHEDNKNENMCHCRYGQQADFGSDNVDI